MKGNWLLCFKPDLRFKYLFAYACISSTELLGPWVSAGAGATAEPENKSLQGLPASTAGGRRAVLFCEPALPGTDLIGPFRLASHFQKRPLSPITVCSLWMQTQELYPSKPDGNEDQLATPQRSHLGFLKPGCAAGCSPTLATLQVSHKAASRSSRLFKFCVIFRSPNYVRISGKTSQIQSSSHRVQDQIAHKIILSSRVFS